MLKKGDTVIIAAVLLLAAISAAFAFSRGGGGTVTVKADNETVYTGSLYYDRTVKLDGKTVVIENGSVYVSDADCKNQICVNHSKKTKKGESIICLPNKVIVEIE